MTQICLREDSALILGTRGSLPVSGRDYLYYGGSTTCVLLYLAGETILLDAGTGIRNLPEAVLRVPRISLLLSHCHADHIIGLSMCPYLAQNGSRLLAVSCALTVERDKEALLAVFPVRMPGVYAEEAYDLIVPDADSRYYTADDISDMPLQVVGDRLVLTGTLNEYSYDEVAAMADNYPANDYERQLNPTYWLMTLDEPQTIEIMSGGSPELVSGEASVIWISEPAGLEQYAGQHLTFSIDPERTWWPSDVSLPLNEPRTSDVNILN